MNRLVRDVIINGVLAWPVLPMRWRAKGLTRLGLDVADAKLSPRCFFGGTDVTIGQGTFVSWEVFFDNQGPVRIGANCDIGQRVQFVTSHHDIGPASRRAGPLAGRAVSVGDGTWIGGGAIILPGVTIGDGCVIAAGSVVTRDCDAHGLYAGAPARRVRDLPTA